MNSKKILFHQRIEQNQEDLLKDVAVPFMNKIKAFYMIMKLRDAYGKAPLAYWNRMKLFVISLTICVLVVYQKVELTDVLQNKMNLGKHSDHEIIPDDVENLETGKPELDKRELRATIVQVIKDLYPFIPKETITFQKS